MMISRKIESTNSVPLTAKPNIAAKFLELPNPNIMATTIENMSQFSSGMYTWPYSLREV